MVIRVVRFVLLVVLGLLVGSMFGIWAGYNPSTLSAAAFIEQHQNAVGGLNTLLPLMGGSCIALTIVLVATSGNDRRTRYLLMIASLLMVAAALVTRFGNQPINAIVMTWNAQSPGADWTQLRDSWWQWHIVRTGSALVAYMLVVFTTQWPSKASTLHQPA